MPPISDRKGSFLASPDTNISKNWSQRKHLQEILYLVGGFNLSEKYGFVSWDDEIPNIWKNKSHVPHHQAVYVWVIS